MHDLQEAFRRCLAMCDACEIRYGRILQVEPYRARSNHGRCICKPEGFCIQVDAKLLADDVPLHSLEQTLLHEICHTLPDGMKHTGAWKSATQALNQRYGYEIKRCNSSAELGKAAAYVERVPARYLVVCKDCGYTIERRTRSKLVKRLRFYRCGKCGGRFKLIERQ